MKYNWQQPDWPDFHYDLTSTEDALFAFAEETGYITGILKGIPENMRMETIIDMMVAEAIKTSAIEGEFINQQDVVSSIHNKLGLKKTRTPVKDQRAWGAGELMVDIRNTYADKLSKEKLFEWHAMLLKQQRGINIGTWRKSKTSMQVISGTIGREKVHFEAPPSPKLAGEMNRFIQWFNDTAPGGSKEIKKALIRSAIAHLYFESIHPFEDGNGRIGRAIAEKALSQSLGRPVLLSLSRSIEANKRAYYSALEAAQHNNNITNWINYFVNTALDAQKQARLLVEFTLLKSRFFDQFKDALNDRQIKVVQKMLDLGPEGFKGGMTAKKYMSITRTSKATATRDLQGLVEIGMLLNIGGGRSIHYALNM